jgi:TolB-like protein
VHHLLRAARERKLVQWALAYLAGAWLLLQVVGLVGQAFGWPNSVLRGATAFLGVGVLAALVLAWYHGERGRQRPGALEVVLIAGIVAVAGAGALLVARPEADDAAADARPFASLERRSVAVLPFDNIGDDPENEYFSDGVAEELLNLLARVDGLRVAARTSSFAFRGSGQDVRTMGRQLGVAYAVAGSVRRAGERVRLTAQLIDTERGVHVWSETYDRRLDDVFAVQEDIARAIASALQLRLPAATTDAHFAGGTRDAEAYNEFLLGLHYWNQRTAEDTHRAIQHLERAIALDSAFARAHALLGLTWVIAPDHVGAAPEDAARRGRAAAERALALDADAADAYTALAGLELLELNWAEAAPLLERAMELNPSYAVAYTWYANLLRAQGRMDEALAYSARAVERDPLAVQLLINHAINLATAGRDHEARALADRILALRPGSVLTYYLRAIVSIELRAYDDAGADLERAAGALGRPPGTLRGVMPGIAAVRSRAPDARARREEAVARLDAWLRDSAEGDLDIVMAAALYTALGEHARALDQLERSLRFAADVLDLPAFAALRGHPRFEELRRRAGLRAV